MANIYRNFVGNLHRSHTIGQLCHRKSLANKLELKTKCPVLGSTLGREWWWMIAFKRANPPPFPAEHWLAISHKLRSQKILLEKRQPPLAPGTKENLDGRALARCPWSIRYLPLSRFKARRLLKSRLTETIPSHKLYPSSVSKIFCSSSISSSSSTFFYNSSKIGMGKKITEERTMISIFAASGPQLTPDSKPGILRCRRNASHLLPDWRSPFVEGSHLNHVPPSLYTPEAKAKFYFNYNLFVPVEAVCRFLASRRTCRTLIQLRLKPNWHRVPSPRIHHLQEELF